MERPRAPRAALTARWPWPSASQPPLSLALFPTALPASPSAHVAEAAPTNTNSSNSVYFRQTAHYIKDAFLNYWLMNGGVTLYGYPVSEETVGERMCLCSTSSALASSTTLIAPAPGTSSLLRQARK